jgi:hypothetical protein
MQKDNQIVEVGTKDISEEIARSLISDNRLFYLFKRVSKITKALCLVTSHIDDSLDIKGRIQKDALDLSDLILSLSYKESSEIGKVKAVAFSKIMSLTSMIEILQSLNQISKSNASILLGQIKLFLEEVEQFFNVSDINPASLSLQLFDFSDTVQESPVSDIADTPSAQTQQSYLNSGHTQATAPQTAHNIETTKLQSKVVQSSFHPTNTEFKERLSTAKSIEQLHGTEVVDTKKTVNTSAPAIPKPKNIEAVVASVDMSAKNENKNDRQTAIINTISIKGELSIKDLSTVIKGCSEKTIQRELISLVDRGILNKTGERRWSRYSLAH